MLCMTEPQKDTVVGGVKCRTCHALPTQYLAVLPFLWASQGHLGPRLAAEVEIDPAVGIHQANLCGGNSNRGNSASHATLYE
jgi:hypothetical protein